MMVEGGSIPQDQGSFDKKRVGMPQGRMQIEFSIQSALNLKKQLTGIGTLKKFCKFF